MISAMNNYIFLQSCGTRKFHGIRCQYNNPGGEYE